MGEDGFVEKTGVSGFEPSGTGHSSTISLIPTRVSFLYDQIFDQLECLVARFGLRDFRSQVLESYDAICRESLSLDPRQQTFLSSAINIDGIPFQLALSWDCWAPTLQFLGEVGFPNSSPAERIGSTRTRSLRLATILRTEKILPRAWQILDGTTSPDNPELLADHAGAYWLGASFPLGGTPKLKIYLNTKWGSEIDQWTRIRDFQACFDSLDRWQEIENALRGTTRPLGVAVNLSANNSISGRVYVGAYGNRIEYYERLAQLAEDDAFSFAFRQCAAMLVGDEREFPMRTVVCSFGNDSVSKWDLKIEFCTHCLFSSDKAAAEKCLQWLEHIRVDPGPYLDVLKTFSADAISSSKVDHHCFVGIGSKRGTAYTTIYLKPVRAK